VCHARLLDDPSTQPFTVSQYFVGDRLTICMTRLKRNRSASGGWPEVHRFARLDSVLHPSTMPITLVIRSTICAGCLALGSVLGAQQPAEIPLVVAAGVPGADLSGMARHAHSHQAIASWPDRLVEWLTNMKMLPAK